MGCLGWFHGDYGPDQQNGKSVISPRACRILVLLGILERFPISTLSTWALRNEFSLLLTVIIIEHGIQVRIWSTNSGASHTLVDRSSVDLFQSL